MLFRISPRSSLCILVPFIAVAATGCLKTRAQLREEPEDGGRETSVSSSSDPHSISVDSVSHGQYALDEVKSEITRLTGRIEELERRQTTSGASKEDFKALESRIVELERNVASSQETLKAVQESGGGGDLIAFFDKGKTFFEAGDYNGAVQNFTAYLKNPKARRAEEAIFLRGESHFQLQEYRKAIVDYSKFPEKYGKSKRLPTVLFRIGLSFEALGMHDDARSFFSELIEKFPKSVEAKKAKTKIK